MYVHVLPNSLRRFDWYDVAHVTIGMLPDVALLEIFHFYVDYARYRADLYQEQIEVWYKLVHVCRKWRNVVFGSPLRLDLRLYCRASTPVKKTLDVWPMLPIVVSGLNHNVWGVDNIVAALEHKDRICQLDIGHWHMPQFEKVLAEMQQPFPALTRLDFACYGGAMVPASFLGGSAPQLQSLILTGIPFPALPKLLLSATNLFCLQLRRIPHSGYISAEAMVTCLSVLTGLEVLVIGFESPRSRPDRQNSRPLTRTLLPVLATLAFDRVTSEYLEDFVARIDTPLLNSLDITFFNQLIFDTPQLTQLISRTPNFKTHDRACVEMSTLGVSAGLNTQSQTFDGRLELKILCKHADWQLSSLAQVCRSAFPQTFIPAVERLDICNRYGPLKWQNDIGSSQWLEVFRPFTGVKGLYVSSELMPHVAAALQELAAGSGTEMLPALQTLFLKEPPSSGPIQENIGKFIAARQLSGHPVVVSRWESEEDESSYEDEEDEPLHKSDEEEDDGSSIETGDN